MSRTSASRRRPSASQPKLVQEKLVPKKRTEHQDRRNPSPAKLPQTPLQRELTTKRRGELAELAFTLKAANLGFGVARPFGDSERYDVILDARDLTDRDLTDRDLTDKDLADKRAKPENVGWTDVGRTLLSAAFDLPATRENAKSKKTPKETAQKNKKKNAKQSAPRIPSRQSSPIPTIPPDPSPPLWRVQVKCSTQLCDGLYRINAHRRINGRAVPYRPGEIHFFAAYIIPEDTWYLIPLSATRGKTSLLFRRRRDRKPGLYNAYREAWHLLRPKSVTPQP